MKVGRGKTFRSIWLAADGFGRSSASTSAACRMEFVIARLTNCTEAAGRRSLHVVRGAAPLIGATAAMAWRAVRDGQNPMRLFFLDSKTRYPMLIATRRPRKPEMGLVEEMRRTCGRLPPSVRTGATMRAPTHRSRKDVTINQGIPGTACADRSDRREEDGRVVKS